MFQRLGCHQAVLFENYSHFFFSTTLMQLLSLCLVVVVQGGEHRQPDSGNAGPGE